MNRWTLAAMGLLSLACGSERAKLDTDETGIGVGGGSDTETGSSSSTSGDPTWPDLAGTSGSSDETGVPVEEGCGDGKRDITEACDDGNTDAGDGCDETCQMEEGFRCAVPGFACRPILCGDAVVEAPETCDDGNEEEGDGCSDLCELEPGWMCAVPGVACRAAACGDGIRAGFEVCDDGNEAAEDGCSPECTLEPGWHCPLEGEACERTECGDGEVEGLEHCDDANLLPFDGCDPQCRNEPRCSGGDCEAICGDGVILPNSAEECDDGNRTDGDGCSSACEEEEGFRCEIEPVPLPEKLELPVIYRDFRGWRTHTDEPRHPDFDGRSENQHTFGIVAKSLDDDGKPVLSGDVMTNNTPQSEESFYDWFRASDRNIVIPDTLVLDPIEDAPGTYRFDSSSFFPLDGRGWAAPDSPAPENTAGQNESSPGHNYNFSTETRYWFQFEGDERLSFRGDDDVWVFVDGHLCLDIGGLHTPIAGVMDLSDPSSETNATQRAIIEDCLARLEVGRMYEVAVFHDEGQRHGSNFRLELAGFATERSTCDWTCGDGIVTPFEFCDDGAEHNTGGYEQCNADCLGRGSHCGDGSIDEEHETCDLGDANVGAYDGCNPDCTPGPRCGDGIRQPEFEECDAGEENGKKGSGCRMDCTRVPVG